MVPSVVDIYLVMRTITWAQTTVNRNLPEADETDGQAVRGFEAVPKRILPYFFFLNLKIKSMYLQHSDWFPNCSFQI